MSSLCFCCLVALGKQVGKRGRKEEGGTPLRSAGVFALSRASSDDATAFDAPEQDPRRVRSGASDSLPEIAFELRADEELATSLGIIRKKRRRRQQVSVSRFVTLQSSARSDIKTPRISFVCEVIAKRDA